MCVCRGRVLASVVGGRVCVFVGGVCWPVL